MVHLDSLLTDIDHPARQMQDTLYIDGRSAGGEKEEDGHLVMHTRRCSPTRCSVAAFHLHIARKVSAPTP